MAELLKLKTGDQVEITYGSTSTVGSVVLASPNHQSLMLQFDCGLSGPYGTFLGRMPVSWIEKRQQYEDIMQGQIVGLRAKRG